MCYEMWEPIFIYTTKMLDSSTGLSVGALLKSIRSDHMTSPFLRIYYMAIYYTITGDVCSCTWQSKSVDSLGQQFLDLLDQASWCHAGMAGSSWLHRCGMGCHRLWHWGIVLDGWHGRDSWSLFHLGCQCCRCRDVGCMHGAGGGDAGCATKKWGLSCGVAGVPLGTVSAALTLHSRRCLCMWQYVEPLLVRTR